MLETFTLNVIGMDALLDHPGLKHSVLCLLCAYTPFNRCELCELLLGGTGATRDSLDQVRDLGFHVIVTANSKGQLWMQHGAGLAATLGSEVVAVDRMDNDQVSLRVRALAEFWEETGRRLFGRRGVWTGDG